MAATDARRLAEYYRTHGFTPFPLSKMSKEPPQGTKLHSIDTLPFHSDDNIGLFPGSENGLAIIDADNEASQIMVTQKLKDLGLYDWTTIIRTPKRGGLHFWLRIPDLPEWVQTYYKLPAHVGGGEFRFRRPAYVVAPGSVISYGEYKFVQGGLAFFNAQPVIPFQEMGWCLPPHALSARSVSGGDKKTIETLYETLSFEYVENPPVLRLFPVLRAENTAPIHKLNQVSGRWLADTYGSRSEAESALVLGLVRAGWSYDEILERFDTEQPGHYASVPNKDRYLERTYEKAAQFAAYLEEKRASTYESHPALQAA